MLVTFAEDCETRARELAARFASDCLPLPGHLPEYDWLLRVEQSGLHLKSALDSCTLHLDFEERSFLRRLRLKGTELVAKAVLGRSQPPQKVLDAAAGLAKDAFVLAARGLQVTLLERSPLLHALLEDAFQRASGNPQLAEILARMTLFQAEAEDWLSEPSKLAGTDAVYLDPMFAPNRSSALPAGEMQLLQRLLGKGSHAENQRLLQAARKAAPKVVLKRMRREKPYGYPNHSFSGRSVRLDVYVQKL